MATGFVLQWIALETTGVPKAATTLDKAADSDEVTDDRDALRTQLTELNTRGRHYASQLWQVPFAYVGIVGVVMAQVADKDKRVIRAALIAGSVFGIPALIHLTAMVNGTKRAVTNIRRLEDALGLIPTVEYMPFWYAGPLVVIVLLTAATCTIAAICLP